MNSHTPTYRHDRLDARPLRRSAAETAPARTVTSEQLFDGANEVVIEHAGAHYRLKITRQGKLILNK